MKFYELFRFHLIVLINQAFCLVPDLCVKKGSYLIDKTKTGTKKLILVPASYI